MDLLQLVSKDFNFMEKLDMYVDWLYFFLIVIGTYFWSMWGVATYFGKNFKYFVLAWGILVFIGLGLTRNDFTRWPEYMLTFAFANIVYSFLLQRFFPSENAEKIPGKVSDMAHDLKDKMKGE